MARAPTHLAPSLARVRDLRLLLPRAPGLLTRPEALTLTTEWSDRFLFLPLRRFRGQVPLTPCIATERVRGMSHSNHLNRGALAALRNRVWLVILAMSACVLSACGAAEQGSGEPELGEISQAVSSPPWVDADIGAVGPAGSATLNSGTFTVQGAGADIWGTADGFHYVHQRLNGNTQVVARVASLNNTN